MLIALAVLQLVNTSGDRLALGLSTALFFAAFGGLLAVCVWAIRGRNTWARGPLLLAQLIAIGLAWNLREYVLVALVLVAVGVAGLVGMVHPQTIAALADDPAASDRS